MKEELAATLRVIRQLKGARYEAISGAISPKHLSMIERGDTQPTLPTLLKLSESLGISVLTLLALCLAVRDQKLPDMEIEQAHHELGELAALGALEIIKANLPDGALTKRARGTKADAERVSAVQALKQQGKTQAEAARELGLPTSTVHRYWTKS
ncbi:Fis family transcriptional regulator [Pseudomonas putida]|nr:Fis family transcriptional regulator [Pseudomonas putida]